MCRFKTHPSTNNTPWQGVGVVAERCCNQFRTGMVFEPTTAAECLEW